MPIYDWYSICKRMEIVINRDFDGNVQMHNHVSVFTLGVLMRGSIILNRNGETQVLKKGDVFLVLPYEPHEITTKERCTLVSVCIEKEIMDKRRLEELYPVLEMGIRKLIKNNILVK